MTNKENIVRIGKPTSITSKKTNTMYNLPKTREKQKEVSKKILKKNKNKVCVVEINILCYVLKNHIVYIYIVVIQCYWCNTDFFFFL